MMGTISLPIPYVDYHRSGHPWAFSFGQPDPCPFCGMTLAEQRQADEARQSEFWRRHSCEQADAMRDQGGNA